MSESALINAKSRLLELFVDLDEPDLETIEQWVRSHSYLKDLENKRLLRNSENVLVRITDAIKEIVPFGAEMPTENIRPPKVGDQADCDESNTCHVDEFLYTDKEVEELVKEEKIKRHYCVDCNSRKIKDLTFVSHSMSRQALQYIFKVLLPMDLEGKRVLDVGSRLGAVLYAAYYFSSASNIVGIEMNKECCEIQEKIISQFSMDTNRIKVIHADVMDKSDIVQMSDIIIMNVLDFFVDTEKHKQIWLFLKKYIRKGSYLVTNRSVAETLGSLEIFTEFSNWVSICRPTQLQNEVLFDIEDCCELFLYTVN